MALLSHRRERDWSLRHRCLGSGPLSVMKDHAPIPGEAPAISKAQAATTELRHALSHVALLGVCVRRVVPLAQKAREHCVPALQGPDGRDCED